MLIVHILFLAPSLTLGFMKLPKLGFKTSAINMVSIGWQQSPDLEDGIKLPPTKPECDYFLCYFKFRIESLGVASVDRIKPSKAFRIPQVERYSTTDWIQNLASIPSSRLLRRIKHVIFWNFICSLIVYIVYKLFPFESPGSRCHSLLGSALGLLLVFRTNASYNRFWEGRKIWERVLSISRDFGRMTVAYAEALGPDQIDSILTYLCAFHVSLREHVQGMVAPELLQQFLSPTDLCAINYVSNRPLFIVGKLSKEVNKIVDCRAFSSNERVIMQKYIDDLSGCIGACERLVQTPVPLTYARHASRFLSLFCLSMPIALVGELGGYILSFVPFMTWCLFGIWEIGMIIEEPFQNALNLGVFATTIQLEFIDLLHITNSSLLPLNITTPSLIQRKNLTTV